MTGPQTTIGQRPHNPRNHFKGNMTSFQPDLFAGSHEFKSGFDYVDNWFGRQYPNLPTGHAGARRRLLVGGALELPPADAERLWRTRSRSGTTRRTRKS